MDEQTGPSEPFPWELGVFDAHCHPTDTMSNIHSSINTMRGRTITVMATRSQDQELVSTLAETHGVRGQDAVTSTRSQPNGTASATHNPERVIPCFGWHPWFSHQLYDDSLSDDDGRVTYDPCSADVEAQKRRHYNAVLAPSPESKGDDGFIKDLPDPRPLSAFIAQTRRYLEAHPYALVGEIGLDKAFRLPSHSPALDDGMTPGRRNGQTLSPYRVHMDHQTRILKAQLNLAGEMGRPVSVHGVQAAGGLYETLKSTWKGHEKKVVSNREKKKIAQGVNENFSDSEDEGDGDRRKRKATPYPPRICLHSFTGTVESLKQYLADDKRAPAKIFFSFSLLVNYSSGVHQHERKKHIADDIILACPDDRILLESDLHSAGLEMDELLEGIYRKVCEVKGWDLHKGVEIIKKNYEQYIFG